MTTERIRIVKMLSASLGAFVPGGSGNVYFRCPFCVGSKTGNSRFTLGVHAIKGVYGCVRCNSGGHITDLMRRESNRLIDSAYSSEEKRVGASKVEGVSLTDYVSFSAVGWNIDEARRVEKREKLTGLTSTMEYGIKRNVPVHVECGYCRDYPYYLMFPIHDFTGSMVFYQGRSSIDMPRKTVNPSVKKPGCLFAPYGYETGKLVLVEGIMDAVRQQGHAILGSQLTEEQRRFIDRLVDKGVVTDILVWYDCEPLALRKAAVDALALWKSVGDHVPVRVIDWRHVWDSPAMMGMDPDALPDTMRDRLMLGGVRGVSGYGSVHELIAAGGVLRGEDDTSERFASSPSGGGGEGLYRYVLGQGSAGNTPACVPDNLTLNTTGSTRWVASLQPSIQTCNLS